MPPDLVKRVLKRYSTPIPDMPGTGGELARHLIERFALDGVTVVRDPQPDSNRYEPGTRRVCLSSDVYDGKSLTAVAVAAHEVGHAIQHARGEPIYRLHGRIWPVATACTRFGQMMLGVTPLILIIVKAPVILTLGLVVVVVALLASLALKATLLPLEFDASFNKALPILAEGYVPRQDLPVVKKILRAAALTYVASALIDGLMIWRIFRPR
ncbi:MAG: zinc metallopeptidase [Gammaproteobacteria bacterium]|nr:MAG: zinc metallopeptidase [Gammaproteobacteria bacterium]